MVSTVGQLLLDQSGEGRKESERERRGGVETQDGVVVGGIGQEGLVGGTPVLMTKVLSFRSHTPV